MLGAWVGVLASISSPALAAEAAEKAPQPPVGYTVSVSLPIVGQTLDRTRQFVRRALEKATEPDAPLVLVFKFEVPPDQAEFARTSEFGAALSLAEFLSSEELNSVRTVAYLPQPVEGHAVLVALACDEIVMAKDASLGPANVDEKVVTESRRGNYREIAGRRRTVPAPIAIWLLDPSQEVLVVETEVSREIIPAGELDALRQRHTIKSQRKLFDPENPESSLAAVRGKLSGEEARALGVASRLVASGDEVARALDLPPSALDEDPSLVGKWNAVRVDLKGKISRDTVDQIKQMIDTQVQQHQVNFVCLWIDSAGGSLADSVDLANFITRQFEQPSRVRTVAYIPEKALSDAAIVALACQQVVMAPQAKLGGSGAEEFTAEEIRQAVVSIRDPDGPWKHRSWSLVAATIDPNVAVFRYTRPGEANQRSRTAFFSELELEDEQRRDPAGKWQKHEQITLVGQPLQLTGEQARDLGLIRDLASSFAEFKQIYGLEHEPRLLEPGWAARLIDVLGSPGAAVLLLMVGFIALYVELHTPGVGAGGFVAAVCFVIFFWSRFLGGTAGWLEATLFVAGVCFLMLEFFVLPGFGVFGLGGGMLVLASLVLASQTFVLPHNAYQFAQLQRSLLTIAGAGTGFFVVAFALRAWLPRAPLMNQMFLPPPEGEEAELISRREGLARYDDLVGQRGTTATQLTPSGKARFGDRLVDVISDGDLIARGAPIEVVDVRGNRVLVRALEGSQ
jgi:membrane-bound ClpP family serine protease